MKQFRITATCFDGSGAPIPVTWYGEAETPDIAVQCMRTKRMATDGVWEQSPLFSSVRNNRS
jgi:hypothetical protein